MFGLFRVKNHDLTITNHIFFQFKGAGGGFPPPGSAPDLQYLQTNDDGKSGVHLSAILRFDFFATSGLQSHLHTVVPITVTLQSSTSWDLIDVCEWMSNLDSTFWDWEKWNQLVYNTLYDEALDLAEQCCVVSSKPRTTGRQRNRANSQVSENKDCWRIILYY